MKKPHVIHESPFETITIEPIDLDPDSDLDPEALMRQVLHDCPECRAAMEAGEVPRIVTFDPRPPRPHPFARRPRWRTRKRG